MQEPTEERRAVEASAALGSRLLVGVAVARRDARAAVVAGTVVPASASGAAKQTAAATPGCGTKPVTMNAYVETGFAVPIDLMNLFHKQHPNVTWKIRQDAFATITQNAPLVLSGPNAPDIMRLPQVSGLVKDHLLKNLDGYFKAFGWNKFPASQLAQVRMPQPVARVVSVRCGRSV